MSKNKASNVADAFTRTLYPNLLAEIIATQYSLDTIAGWAHITNDLLLDVLTVGTELSRAEMLDIFKYLWGCSSFQYLYASKLSVVDPATNRGKYRAYQLQDALKTFYRCYGPPQLIGDNFLCNELLNVNEILYRLNHGELVTYASYRQSFCNH